jgi:hypothetical protein
MQPLPLLLAWGKTPGPTPGCWQDSRHSRGRGVVVEGVGVGGLTRVLGYCMGYWYVCVSERVPAWCTARASIEWPADSLPLTVHAVQ